MYEGAGDGEGDTECYIQASASRSWEGQAQLPKEMGLFMLAPRHGVAEH